MKKYITLILLLLILVITGCQKDNTSIKEEVFVKTPYERAKEIIEGIDLGDLDNVTTQLVLPDNYGEDVFVTWTTSDATVINSDGNVFRPEYGEGNSDVVLDVQVNIAGTNLYKTFNATVIESPGSALEKLLELENSLNIGEIDHITRDIMVLPRVSSTYGAKITWQSSDESVIDLSGNITNPKTGSKEVILTASISLGGGSITKEFTATVYPKPAAKYDTITVDDDRALRKISVTNSLELREAYKQALPGDMIILEDGVYRGTTINELYCGPKENHSGTQEHPIFIIARNPGAVTFIGSTEITIEGDNVIIANLYFKNGAPKDERGVIWLKGEHIRLTNTKIYNFELLQNDFKWLSLTGKYIEIDHCEFDGKKTGGALLTVWRDDNSSQYHHIHDNKFMNYTDIGGANGYETIRIGTSTYSQSDSHILIENNHFEKVNGEIEIISIKSGSTIVRNNSFYDSVGLITCRHGKNSLILNNYIDGGGISNTGGIRMYDGGHVIKGNYITNIDTTSNTRAGIVIHSGVNKIGEPTTMNAQWVAFDCVIENNTIVDSIQSILFGGKFAEISRDIILKNNLILTNKSEAIRFDKDHKYTQYEGNYICATAFSAASSTAGQLPVPNGVEFTTTMPEYKILDNGIKTYLDYGSGYINYEKTNAGCSWDF